MRILGILPATLVAAALVAGCSGQPTAPATGAASVGVTTPDQMPPTMINGIISAGPASLVAAQISPRVARTSPLSQPLFLPYQTQTPISAAAITSPGTIPAIDSCRIDTPEMKA